MKSNTLKFFYIFFLLFSIGNCKFPNKIIGGNVSRIEEYPSAVSIRSAGKHNCGGTIIDEKHILTAAHCVLEEKNIIDNDIQILTGTNNQHEYLEGEIHEVIIISVHPEYNDKTFENDIAICTLEEPIKTSNLQRPIMLATDEVPVNSIVIITGWGFLNHESGINSRYLRKLDMSIVDGKECQRWYVNIINPSKQICTRRQDEKTISNGDSGGGLIYRDQLIGIASASSSDGSIEYPVIYTSVLAYKNWIEKIIERY